MKDHPLHEIHGLVTDELKWPEVESKIEKEGEIKFKVAAAESIYDAPAFFNPVMVANRDLALLFTKVYSNRMNVKLRIFEPLAGIGIRAFRLAHTIPDAVDEVVISDYNPVTTAIANVNKYSLDLIDKVFQFKREARSLALDLAENRMKYHFVDLDPFGPPSPFIDTMWPLLSYRAMIAVTATDMTALCGVYPDAGLRKYGGIPVNNHHCHETAARLLIAMVVQSAARFEKGIQPIFTTSIDHYTKVFFKVRTSRGDANVGVKQIGFSFTCKNCHQIYYTKLHHQKPTCCGDLIQAGPLWTGDLFNSEWCNDAKEVLAQMSLPSERRIAKLLEEGINHQSLTGFYKISALCKIMNISQPSFADLFEKIEKAGYSVVRSQFTDQSLRSDIPGPELKQIIRDLVEVDT